MKGSHTKGDLLDWDHAGSINGHYSKKLGFTHIEYDKLIRYQNYRCACCGSESAYNSGSQKFHVDHCHETNRVRGLLCKSCNHALGMCGDSIEGLMRLVNYLKSAASRPDPKELKEKDLPPRRKQYAKVKVWWSNREQQYMLQWVRPKTLERCSRNTGTTDKAEAVAMAMELEARINRPRKEGDLVEWLKSTEAVIENDVAQICAEHSCVP